MRTLRLRARWLAGLALLLTALLAGCSPFGMAPAHGTPTPDGAATITPVAATAAPATPIIAPHGAVTRTLRLASAPAACPVDAAWSPDGAELAVLATRDTCLARPATKLPDLIILYNPRTGAIVRQISLAAALTSEKANILPEPRWGFSGLSWSPDGATIAVPFFQYTPTPPSGNADSDPRGMGVLLASATTGAVRALLGPSNFGPDPTGVSRFHAATIWDVRTGQPAGSVAIPLSPAASYTWSVTGQIAPTPTSAAAAATAGAGFFYWQPGFLAPVSPNTPSATSAWVFASATFSRWSPDGRYLAVGLMTQNRASATAGAPTTSDPAACADYQLPQPCGDQPIPASDAALQAVLATVLSAAVMNPPAYMNPAPVVWSPDRATLATVLPGDAASEEHHAITLTLFATADGRATSQITVPIAGMIVPDPQSLWPYFAWAPGGKQLAVVNAVDNTIAICAVP